MLEAMEWNVHAHGGASYLCTTLLCFLFPQKDGMENIEKIRNVKVPTFFVGGTNDKDVPPEHTEQLFQVRCGSAHPELRGVTPCRLLKCFAPLALSLAPLFIFFVLNDASLLNCPFLRVHLPILLGSLYTLFSRYLFA